MIEGKRFLSSFFDKHPTQKKKAFSLEAQPNQQQQQQH